MTNFHCKLVPVCTIYDSPIAIFICTMHMVHGACPCLGPQAFCFLFTSFRVSNQKLRWPTLFNPTHTNIFYNLFIPSGVQMEPKKAHRILVHSYF